MSTAFYELAILGNVTTEVVTEIQHELSTRLAELGFVLGQEVNLYIGDP